MRWILIGIVLFAAYLLWKPKRHRHYCDTCKHGLWSQGRCYCEVYRNRMYASEVRQKAGCTKWVSRR